MQLFWLSAKDVSWNNMAEMYNFAQFAAWQIAFSADYMGVYR